MPKICYVQTSLRVPALSYLTLHREFFNIYKAPPLIEHSSENKRARARENYERISLSLQRYCESEKEQLLYARGFEGRTKASEIVANYRCRVFSFRGYASGLACFILRAVLSRIISNGTIFNWTIERLWIIAARGVVVS